MRCYSKKIIFVILFILLLYYVSSGLLFHTRTDTPSTHSTPQTKILNIEDTQPITIEIEPVNLNQNQKKFAIFTILSDLQNGNLHSVRLLGDSLSKV